MCYETYSIYMILAVAEVLKHNIFFSALAGLFTVMIFNHVVFV